MLLADDSHQAESHISRFLRKYDVTDCKRADSNEWVLCYGKKILTVPDDITRGRMALRHDQTEFVKTRCELASVSRARAKQESSAYNKRNPRDATYDRELALGNRRDTHQRVICDKSVAEETIGIPGIRSQAGSTNCEKLEKSAGNWFEVWTLAHKDVLACVHRLGLSQRRCRH